MRKKIIIVLTLLLVVCVMGFFHNPSVEQSKIEEVYNYSKSHNMNTDIVILCDFGIHSGKKRFMVYDFNKKKVIFSSLCAQGKGQGFSNKEGSFCSSLGYYKIGYYHKMSSGLWSYSLIGLSMTNSNALKRGILIHPYPTVLDIPIYPLQTSRKSSKGCFVISPIKFLVLNKIIKKHSSKPILMYSYVSKE